MVADAIPTTFEMKYYTINALYCPMILPASLQSMYIVDLAGPSLSITTADADNGSCGYTGAITSSDGLTLPNIPFTLADSDQTLQVSAIADESLVGTYSFVYTMTSA